MENAERNGIGDEQDTEFLENIPKVLAQSASTIYKIVSQQTAADDGSKIDNKDAPIGKRITTEIPVYYTRKYFHANKSS